MKRLVCEMCGGSDLIKDGGVFVCQSCGCKYSVEEAKRMMVEGTVEVTGAVQIDHSNVTGNYMTLAENAYEAGNYAEAENYCNKIIESDVNNSRAWFLKAKAAGWQSTLGKSRLNETVASFGKALENCPEDEKAGMSIEAKDELRKLHHALLSTRMQYLKNPSQSTFESLSSDIMVIFDSSQKFISVSGIDEKPYNITFAKIIFDGVNEAWPHTSSLLKENGNHPTDYNFNAFISESAILDGALNLAKIFIDPEFEDEEEKKLMVKILKLSISIHELRIRSCSYAPNYIDGVRFEVKNLRLVPQAVKEERQVIAEAQQKIERIGGADVKAEAVERLEKSAPKLGDVVSIYSIAAFAALFVCIKFNIYVAFVISLSIAAYDYATIKKYGKKNRMFSGLCIVIFVVFLIARIGSSMGSN